MLDTERIVRERYSEAAREREATLCCPVNYDAEYLRVIPQEVIDRDYGCGDPSKHVRRGETVLDLGSGGGKICFIASQVVGPEGRVIGVDLNDEMLDLARRSQSQVALAIGHDNVSFKKGKIQDLAIDRDRVDRYLCEHPVNGEASLRSLESFLACMRRDDPMIADESVDVVVSNCVLNLVDTAEKEILFDEIFRVLRPGGRAVISDIVADQAVPQEYQSDPELWSGCISGAMPQAEFIDAFEQAGFVDARIESLQRQPWQVVGGIAFRALTLIAYRPHTPSEKPSILDGSERYVYRGPFKHVVDDEGRMYTRGETCDASLSLSATRDAVANQFVVYEQLAQAKFSLPTAADGCCSEGGCC